MGMYDSFVLFLEASPGNVNPDRKKDERKAPGSISAGRLVQVLFDAGRA
jgi:hypothetical protein